ncbi:hypothetical protein CKS_0418 [Pantoea stewartii subsp. stewartii DC283]|uniref:Uncharacterized protein n=1 Tax=Pantoea stewartii subsp. stewartii DC283 TaxID=660596 RepID=H3R9T6_PANSE|nr:hypothetical protein CKS_0418 [Pantoea stewartii subsp. stewartii DC283]
MEVSIAMIKCASVTGALLLQIIRLIIPLQLPVLR